tara:strand:+ start:141 stop:1028 length:888 start_codon:yes stop_codon:yes gene_type:complete
MAKKKNQLVKKQQDLIPFLDKTSSLGNILNVLDEKDTKTIIRLQKELEDTFHKSQVYRTETEARISILNDIKFPTPAAKYWQSVREQNLHFEEAVGESYHIRHLNLQIYELELKIAKLKKKGAHELKIWKKEYDRDTKKAELNNVKRSLKWRIKELEQWSKIKAELDDGSFDTTNPDTDLGETYKHYWANRVKALHSESGPAEIINALGSYIASEKLTTEDNKVLPFNEVDNSPPKLTPPNFKNIEKGIDNILKYEKELYEGQIITENLEQPDNQLLDENVPNMDYKKPGNTSWF